MQGLNGLRRRYPWPAECPDVPDDMCGWFADANRTALAPFVAQAKIVLELGSFHGMSSLWFCETAPHITLICIDHWKGSIEHHRRPDWAKKLPLLYETFLRNLWPYRDRVIPMRTTTQAGLPELAELKIKPKVIYVDAAHDEESVFHDVSTSRRLFPDAEIFGDDWTLASVRSGVKRACGDERLIELIGNCAWHLR